MAVITSVLAALFLAIAQGAQLNVASAKEYPVSKLIALLKGMQESLQKEADMDEEVYDKVACWCETNDKEKTQGISDAQQRLVDLQATIEKKTATSTRLNVEIPALESEVAKDVEALATMEALRAKQSAEFNAEEKEMIESIKALEAAIVVLSKHFGKASLIVDQQTLSKVMTMADEQMRKHKELLRGTITPAQQRMLGSFAQEPDYFDAEPTFKQAYAPQGGEIYGIIKQMKETFENDLSGSQQEEIQNQKTFVEVKAAKEEEIRIGKIAIQEKKERRAAADEALAQAKEDQDDTRSSLNADQKFLTELKVKCSLTDKEWEERQKTRTEELAAVAEAISILSTDDARELFSRTLEPETPSFLQVFNADRSARRGQAASVLRAVAAKTHSPRLAALAASVQLDAFVRVKKAIDDMVTQLLKEKDDEIKHKEFCVKGLNENELSTEKTVHEKGVLESKIEGLKMTITGYADEIETLTGEISDLKANLLKAKVDREKENLAYKTIVKDQRDSVELLQKAYDVLKQAYASKTAHTNALVQQASGSAQGPAAPPGFATYEKNRGAGGVLAIIEQIITDAQLMEKEATKSEEESQRALEGLVQETTESVVAKEDNIVNKVAEKSKTEQDLTQANTELEDVDTEVENLAESKGSLRKDCDFTLNNFSARQAGRDQEVEALRQAKAYLSGMKPPA